MNFMSKVWEELIKIQSYFDSALSQYGTEVSEPGMDRFNKPGWINKVLTSDAFRRAHLDVVDARETKGLWMMHCCIFPHIHNPAPIFGFDVIAGKNKITGVYYDNLNRNVVSTDGTKLFTQKISFDFLLSIPNNASKPTAKSICCPAAARIASVVLLKGIILALGYCFCISKAIK